MPKNVETAVSICYYKCINNQGGNKMNLPYVLRPHFSRKSTFFPLDYKGAPAALENEPVKPDFSSFPLPLPSKKSDYRCCAVTDDGALWAGASNGVTRCRIE